MRGSPRSRGARCASRGAGVVLLVLAVSCGRGDDGEADRSVVIEGGGGGARAAVRGASYEVAEFGVDPTVTVFVPVEASVRKSDVATVSVFIKKSLGFAGVPLKPMSPLTARRAMGIAIRRAEGEVTCGTYGEWRNMEGQASMHLSFVIPVHVPFRQRAGLAGPRSEAALDEPLWWLVHRKDDPDYWFAASVPAQGWTAVPSAPDPDRRADSAE